MAGASGLDPERAEDLAVRLRSTVDGVPTTAILLSRIAAASADPDGSGIAPGGAVLDPASIALVSRISALVLEAVAVGAELVSRLLDEVAAQRDASRPEDAGYGAKGGYAAKTLASSAPVAAASLLARTASSSSASRSEEAEQSILANLGGTPTATPEEIAEWWGRLTHAQQAELLKERYADLGSLGGIPTAVRVEANRLSAADRLEVLQDEDRWTVDPGVDQTFSDGIGLRNQEQAYLERVVAGEVDLYLYDAASDRIIEVIGDPDTASVILTFVPGTNTELSSFYDPDHPVTDFARWQVENAGGRTEVAGFVFEDGPFPQADGRIITDGPQWNHFATERGADYARLVAEIRATTSDLPIVSVEHSAGSGIVGEAERLGAVVDTRITLAGIGMLDGWSANPDTNYIAMQASDDINRLLDDVQFGGLGYEIPADEASGYTVLDSGVRGFTEYVDWDIASMLSPPVGAVRPIIDVVSGLDNHNQIVSADESENRAVLHEIRKRLAEAGEER